jgi:hypothetical protein
MTPKLLQELTVQLLQLLMFSSRKPSILSPQERSTLLSHLLASLFTSPIPPTSSPSTSLDPLRTHLERCLPAFACQAPDSKRTLVHALIRAARDVLAADKCYAASSRASKSATSAAAVPKTPADAAKSLVQCVLELLLLPLSSGSSGNILQTPAAPPEEGARTTPGALPDSSDDESDADPDGSHQDPQNNSSRNHEEEDRGPGEASAQGLPGPPEGGIQNSSAPEVWVYEFLLQCLQEAAVASTAIKACKLDKYIKQLLKSARAESVPLHALSHQQVRKLKV